MLHWRRRWDSNPRYRSPGTAVFKTAALNHSTTPPRVAGLLSCSVASFLSNLETQRLSNPFLANGHVDCDLEPQLALAAQLVGAQRQRDGDLFGDHFLRGDAADVVKRAHDLVRQRNLDR